ncbi:hypothetical protein BH10PSE19_BH10PSE19_04860 [soil metagenome]
MFFNSTADDKGKVVLQKKLMRQPIHSNDRKTSIPEQRIIDCLSADYGIEVAALTFLPLGADMNASIYKAQVHDQSSYFIKLKYGHQHQDISSCITALLYDAGIQHIILPIKTSHGQLAQHINDFILSVFPFVKGQNGFSCDLTDDQWVMLAYKSIRH